MDMEAAVKEFRTTYGLPVNEEPTLLPYKDKSLHDDLLEEELEELGGAEYDDDMKEIADAIGDAIYILFGRAVHMGLPINRILQEIHTSNMSKLGEDGKPIYREDGKVLKGPNFFEPRIQAILDGEL